jgi:hypothetical protein
MKDTPERRAKFQKGYAILLLLVREGKLYKEVAQEYGCSTTWVTNLANSAASAWAAYEGIPLLDLTFVPWLEEARTLADGEAAINRMKEYRSGGAARRDNMAFDDGKSAAWRDGWLAKHRELVAERHRRKVEEKVQDYLYEQETLKKLKVPEI